MNFAAVISCLVLLCAEVRSLKSSSATASISSVDSGTCSASVSPSTQTASSGVSVSTTLSCCLKLSTSASTSLQSTATRTTSGSGTSSSSFSTSATAVRYWFVYWPWASPSDSRTIALGDSICSASRPGGFLATPLTWEQNDGVVQSLPSNVSLVLLGGSRRFRGGKYNTSLYRWVAGSMAAVDGGVGPVFFNGSDVNGTCVTPPFVCNFALGEPDNKNAAEFAVAMFGPAATATGPAAGGIGKWCDIAPEATDGCACMSIGRGAPHDGVTESPRVSATNSLWRGSLSISPTIAESTTLSASKATEPASLSASASLTKRSRTRTRTASDVTPSSQHSLSRTSTIARRVYASLRNGGSTVDGAALTSITYVNGTLQLLRLAVDVVGATFPPWRRNETGGSSSDCLSKWGSGNSSSSLGGEGGAVAVKVTMSSDVAARTVSTSDDYVPSLTRRITQWVSNTTSLSVTGPTTAALWLTPSMGTFGNVAAIVTVQVSIDASRCLDRADVAPLQVTFSMTPTVGNPVEQHSWFSIAHDIAVLAAVLDPLLAIQSSRNDVPLQLQYCTSSEAVMLATAKNPVGYAIGDSPVSGFAGATAMNQVIILGSGLIMPLVVTLVWIVSNAVGSAAATWSSWAAALHVPWLVLYPLMVLMQPSATSAITTALHADDDGLMSLGIVSAALCGMYPCIVAAYLWFAGHRITSDPGQQQQQHAPQRGWEAVKRVLLLLLELACSLSGGDPGVDGWADGAHTVQTQGKSSIDTETASQNALPYVYVIGDYRVDSMKYFVVAELMLGASLGALQAVTLGYDQCRSVLYAAATLLGVFTVSAAVFRPYRSPLFNGYLIVVSSLQFSAAVLLCLPRASSRTDAAVIVSEVAAGLVVGKAALNVVRCCVAIGLYVQRRSEERAAKATAERRRQDDIDELAEYAEIPVEWTDAPLTVLVHRVSRMEPSSIEESELSPLIRNIISKCQAVAKGAGAGSERQARTDWMIPLMETLDAVAAKNVELMKRAAHKKFVIDGQWRDWRHEALRLPFALMGLRRGLHGVLENQRLGDVPASTLMSPYSTRMGDFHETDVTLQRIALIPGGRGETSKLQEGDFEIDITIPEKSNEVSRAVLLAPPVNNDLKKFRDDDPRLDTTDGIRVESDDEVNAKFFFGADEPAWVVSMNEEMLERDVEARLTAVAQREELLSLL